MNTRLQVEHPVTESVVVRTTPQQRATGASGEHVDLVRLQLLVAAGEPLPFGQDDLTLSGHAIEARVYAEDPFHGFLPQAGTATFVRWPDARPGGRGTGDRQVVSTSYDPMLGKIIARGADRETARRALVAALDDTAILGLTTNLGFLRALVAGDEFRDAAIDTAWLDTATVEAPGDDLARVFAAWTDVAVLADQTDAGPVRPRRLAARPGTPRPCWSSSTTSCASTGPATGSTRPRCARSAPRPARRRAPPRPDPRRPAPRGGRRARAGTPSRSSTRATAGSSSGPTCSPTRAPGPGTARSSRRCPAPCSTSGSTEGQPSPRATCWG